MLDSKRFTMFNRPIVRLIQQSIEDWVLVDAFLYASSVAYFTIFSLAPLVIIVVDIAGMIFSQQVIEAAIFRVISGVAGDEMAGFVVDLIPDNSYSSSSGVIALIGILVLLYGASIVFARLQMALDAMWGLRPKTTSATKSAFSKIRGRIFAAFTVVGLGLYLLIGLIFGVVWFSLPKPLVDTWLGSVSQFIITVINVLALPLIFLIPFMLIYKYLPQATVRWRDVWPGSLLSATLFWIGGFFIGIYLAFSGVTSVYGAAGSLVAFLIWIFYSACIFLYGATFIKAYADIYGSPIIPDEHMMFANPVSVTDPQTTASESEKAGSK